MNPYGGGKPQASKSIEGCNPEPTEVTGELLLTLQGARISPLCAHFTRCLCAGHNAELYSDVSKFPGLKAELQYGHTAPSRAMSPGTARCCDCAGDAAVLCEHSHSPAALGLPAELPWNGSLGAGSQAVHIHWTVTKSLTYHWQ